jgi:murein DD-endopeptidase MepM/ murein hydrolase activator NlpD
MSSRSVKRSLAIALLLVLGVAAAGPLRRHLPALLQHPLLAMRLARAQPAPRLLVPVQGVRVRALRDSWDAPRSGGRKHRGIDIFARRGTPVVSATPGIVVSIGTDRLGGNVVRVFGPGGEWHYYAHLDRFAAISRGQRVSAGEMLGFVGDTGNARGTPPHLHYGIYRPHGAATNPYPRLAARR